MPLRAFFTWPPSSVLLPPFGTSCMPNATTRILLISSIISLNTNKEFDCIMKQHGEHDEEVP